jgi:hypothetical protein
MRPWISRWRTYGRDPRTLFTDSVKRVFDRTADAGSRRWCAVFALLLGCPIVAIPLIAADPDRVGVGWLYALIAVGWAFVIEGSVKVEQRQPGSLPTTGLAILIVEVALGLSAGWWNGWLPDPLRAVGWGILIPGGFADVVAALLAIAPATLAGDPVY